MGKVRSISTHSTPAPTQQGHRNRAPGRPPMARGRLLLAACLLQLLAASAHYEYPRNASTVRALRKHLLSDLDSFTHPDIDGVSGIQIGVQFRFFKVIKVDMASSQLTVKVWKRIRWNDPRLAWNPEEWGGVTQIMVYPNSFSGGQADGIDNNMWTPQLMLYNGIAAMDKAMETGGAWVTHDGGVWYATPGVIDLACRFAGLQRFPYDELTCPFEVASWSYSDLVTNLTYMEDRPCVDLAVDNPSAGTTYQEYLLTGVDCNKFVTNYPCCGDATFTTLVMNLKIKRSTFAYTLSIEIPGILITTMAFCTLWLDAANVGERLGYCATMLLAVQLLMIVVSDMLPTCGETLWIEVLNFVNLSFCLVTLAWSCVIVHLTFRGVGTIQEELSERLDSVAARVLPCAYAVTLGMVYSLDLDDGYNDDPNKKMFEGTSKSKVAMSIQGIVVPLVLLAAFVTWKTCESYKLCERWTSRRETMPTDGNEGQHNIPPLSPLATKVEPFTPELESQELVVQRVNVLDAGPGMQRRRSELAAQALAANTRRG